MKRIPSRTVLARRDKSSETRRQSGASVWDAGMSRGGILRELEAPKNHFRIPCVFDGPRLSRRLFDVEGGEDVRPTRGAVYEAGSRAHGLQLSPIAGSRRPTHVLSQSLEGGIDDDTKGETVRVADLDRGDAAVAAVAVAGGEGQAVESDLAWEQVFPVRDVFGRVQSDEIAHEHVRPLEGNLKQSLDP